MARNQATTYTSIWSDPEFTALTSGAQRTYWLVCSQPKLSLAGAIDCHPKRWARLAPDTPEAVVTDALAELEESRFLVVHEDELVVRTFVANDLCRGALNVNLVKGMWSAWAAIASPLLRKVVVDEMPSKAWDRDGVTRPNEADRLRSEPRLELPLRPQSEPSVLCSLFSADCSESAVPTVDRPADPSAVAQSIAAARGALRPVPSTGAEAR